MVADPRRLDTNPARGWVAIVPDDASYDYVGFDLTLSETHGSEAVITNHPVEDGTDVTDNVRPQPGGFECVVYVSNTPVIAAGVGATPANMPEIPAVNDISVPLPPQALAKPPGAPIYTPGGIFQAAGAAIGGAISLLTGDGTPTSISPTTFVVPFDAVLATYERLLDLQARAVTMTVFTSIVEYDSMAISKVSIPRDHVGGAEITIAFRKIQTVKTATTTAPKPTVPAGNPPVSKGAQNPSATTAPPTTTSILKQLAGKLL